MAFHLNARQSGDVTVIDFCGPITLSVASNVIRETMRDLIAGGRIKILLNMGSVAYIDSYGIGEMVAGYSSVRNAGGTLKLLSLNKRVKEVLEITKLHTIFDVQDDEEAAVRSSRDNIACSARYCVCGVLLRDGTPWGESARVEC